MHSRWQSPAPGQVRCHQLYQRPIRSACISVNPHPTPELSERQHLLLLLLCVCVCVCVKTDYFSSTVHTDQSPCDSSHGLIPVPGTASELVEESEICDQKHRTRRTTNLSSQRLSLGPLVVPSVPHGLLLHLRGEGWRHHKVHSGAGKSFSLNVRRSVCNHVKWVWPSEEIIGRFKVVCLGCRDD